MVSRRRPSLFVVGMLVLLPAGLLVPQSADALGDWQISLVDLLESPLSVYATTSIALDTHGSVHMGYCLYNDSVSDSTLVRHASGEIGSWVLATVDRGEGSGSVLPVSIIVDSADVVHIGYSNLTIGGPQVRYARGEGTSWSIMNVSSGYGIGAMCLDSQGYVHFCYGVKVGFETALAYSTNAGGSWSEVILDDQGNSMRASMAIDSEDKIHISYTWGPQYSVRYATNSGGSWTNEPVDSGRYGSIALDWLGVPHIIYVVEGEVYGQLKLATRSGGSWTNVTVDEGPLDISPSIAIDSSDQVHLCYSYTPGDSATLFYAQESGESWLKSTVEYFETSIPYLGRSSIALDSVGGIHISYARGQMSDFDTGGGIKYATNSSFEIPEFDPFEIVLIMLAVTSLMLLFRNRDSK